MKRKQGLGLSSPGRWSCFFTQGPKAFCVSDYRSEFDQPITTRQGNSAPAPSAEHSESRISGRFELLDQMCSPSKACASLSKPENLRNLKHLWSPPSLQSFMKACMCRRVPAEVQVRGRFVESSLLPHGFQELYSSCRACWKAPLSHEPAQQPYTKHFATRNLVCVFCCVCCCFYFNRFTLLTPNSLLSSSLLVGIDHIFFGWFSFSFILAWQSQEESPAQGYNSEWVSGTTVSTSVIIFLKWSFQQDNSEIYLLFIYLFFKCIWVFACMYVCVPSVHHICPSRGQKIPQDWSYRWLWAILWVGTRNLT